jgi:hypothetical protein
MTVTAATDPPILVEIRRLARLRQRGTITVEELKARKAAVLSKTVRDCLPPRRPVSARLLAVIRLRRAAGGGGQNRGRILVGRPVKGPSSRTHPVHRPVT